MWSIVRNWGSPIFIPPTASLSVPYLFDEENPDSVILSMKRAYDNGVVLREELSSNVLSYIQLALNTLEACQQDHAPCWSCSRCWITFWHSGAARTIM